MAGISSPSEFAALGDEGRALRGILDRARARMRNDLADPAMREAQERIRQGPAFTSKDIGGALNPATGLWHTFSVPGIPGLCSGATYYPKNQ